MPQTPPRRHRYRRRGSLLVPHGDCRGWNACGAEGAPGGGGGVEGRIANVTGDGVLVEFASVVNAVW